MGTFADRVRRAASAAVIFGCAVLVAPVAANAGAPAVVAPQNGVCPTNITDLLNGSFEAPVIPADSHAQTNASDIPGWNTATSNGKIDIWANAFKGITAAEGRQFIQLDQSTGNRTYQDVATTPGQTLVLTFMHRGEGGEGTMPVYLGAPGQSLPKIATFVDGAGAWVRHTLPYTVPAGQTVTRVAFESLSVSGGGPAVGRDLLDAVGFGSVSCIFPTKSVSPDNNVAVNIGDVLSYRVDVLNEGGTATATASVTDTIPTNTTLICSSVALYTGTTTIPVTIPGCNASTTTITVDLVGSTGPTVGTGIIEPGQTASLLYQVSVNSAAAGTTVSNTASASSTDLLGNATNNRSTNTTSNAVRALADVAINKDATDVVDPGDQITYTFVVANNGPSTATDLTMTDTLPAGTTIDPGSLPPECSASGQTVTCSRASLAVTPPGSFWNFSFTATVDPSQGPGVLINTATVLATGTDDPDLSNNTSSAVTAVTPLTPSATLEVTKVALNPTVNPGDTAVAEITVTNRGSTSSGTVLLTDLLPAGITVTNATPDAGTCNIAVSPISCNLGTIATGISVRVAITGTVSNSVSPGDLLSDTAEASDGSTTDSATATFTVSNEALLTLQKQAPPTAVAGQPLTYQVTMSNGGPNAALNTSFEDTLPAGVTLIDAPGNCALASGKLTCTIGTLAANTVSVTSYTVLLPEAGGTFINDAAGSSDATCPVGSTCDLTDSAETTAAGMTNLTIAKAASTSTIASGGTVEYTITATNAGPATATAVDVRDLPSAGITFTAFSVSTGSFDSATGIWSVGNLAVGATVTATVTGTITGGPGTYANMVYISGAQDDPDPTNTTSIAEVVIPGTGGGDGGGGGGGGRIATTGLDAMPLTSTGMMFLASGSALVAFARRRRRSGSNEPVCLD